MMADRAYTEVIPRMVDEGQHPLRAGEELANLLHAKTLLGGLVSSAHCKVITART
jgi:hypothetical protein